MPPERLEKIMASIVPVANFALVRDFGGSTFAIPVRFGESLLNPEMRRRRVYVWHIDESSVCDCHAGH